MIHLALFEPEIPPNTGNIIRLCANTGTQLHIIEPMGFDWSDKRLRRAGLDYAEYANVKRYEDWVHFKEQHQDKHIFGLTTKSNQNFFDLSFVDKTDPKDTLLLLGPETRGLPEEILNELNMDNCFRIPMVENSRSLNLSNAAAICVYEVWRQLGFN